MLRPSGFREQAQPAAAGDGHFEVDAARVASLLDHAQDALLSSPERWRAGPGWRRAVSRPGPHSVLRAALRDADRGVGDEEKDDDGRFHVFNLAPWRMTGNAAPPVTFEGDSALSFSSPPQSFEIAQGEIRRSEE